MNIKHKKVFNQLYMHLNDRIKSSDDMARLFEQPTKNHTMGTLEQLEIKDVQNMYPELHVAPALELLEMLRYMMVLGKSSNDFVHSKQPVSYKPKSFQILIEYLTLKRTVQVRKVEKMSSSCQTSKRHERSFVTGYSYYIEKLNDPKFINSLPDSVQGHKYNE